MLRHPAINFILQRARPHASLLLLILVGELLASATTLALPQVAGASIEALMANTLSSLSWSLVLVAVLMFFRMVFAAWTAFAAQNVSNKIEKSTRQDFHAHLLSLSLADHQRLGTTALIDSEFHDLWGVRNLVMAQPPKLIGALVTGVGALVFALSISWQLTLLTGISGPLLYLAVRLAGRKIEAISKRYWKAIRRANSIDLENLRVVALLKTFAREPERHQEFSSRLSEVVRVGRDKSRLDATFSPITRSIELFAVAFLVYATSQGYVAQGLSTVELGQFVMYSFLLITPFRTMTSIIFGFKEERGSLDRVAELLVLKPEEQGPIDLQDVRGQVEFRGISFGYPEREPVLSDVSVTFNAKEIVALTGPNGGGKSTLVSLMLGLWRCDSGDILIDGKNLQTLTLSSVRRSICLVTQHTELLDATIKENLRFVRPEATDDEIAHACHLALVDEFLSVLPEGLETAVGDSGLKLSGGQRQRLAIARAILADPPVLVLDEATSMFDPESELRFLDLAMPWLRQRTVVFITHRPAPLAHVDRVMLVKNHTVHERANMLSSADS
jgi:ATP-binding cassette subfamily B protein